MSFKTSFALSIYAAATGLMRPAARVLLARRHSRGKEDGVRIAERRGRSKVQRPKGALVWLHAASIGEFMSLLPVINGIVERNIHVLVTTGTVTSAHIAAARLPLGAFHQFVPLDIPAYARRFLKHWQPDLVLFAESEIWPNLMAGILKRKIPLGIINGRMSERSYTRWAKLQGLLAGLLSRVDFCLAQTSGDAARFKNLGANRVEVSGNLKFDCPALPYDTTELASLREIIGQRNVWLAASTHEGEEEIIIAAHQQLTRKYPHLLTIIVPRHPERGVAISQLAVANNIRVGLRSKDGDLQPATSIYVADTMGELGLFYRLSPVALIGASLIEPGGGHNPIEPAQLDTALLQGLNVSNFSDIYRRLMDNNGSFAVEGVDELVAALDRFFSNPALVKFTATQAFNTVKTLQGAVEQTFSVLEPYLLQLELIRTRNIGPNK